jgi:hypothetical protein
MPDEHEFDPLKFFEELRKAASIKVGATMFGEAQIAYYNTLKEHMDEDHAYNMLAHTTEQVIKGAAMAIGPVISAFLYASRHVDIPTTDKQVPGSDEPS